MQTLDRTIGFLGAGNMAEALIKGILAVGLVEPGRVWGSDPRQTRCDELKTRYQIHATVDNLALMAACDLVVLSVKPQILSAVLTEIAPALRPNTLLVSIAAGVPVSAIERLVPAGTRVVRTMPNTPALVGAGATAIAAGGHATPADLEVAKCLFDAVGMTVILDEEQLDAVTGLSGPGPAYVFLIIEALSDAGVKMGLSRYNALALSAQTVLGAAKLLIETGEPPGRLKDRIYLSYTPTGWLT